MISSAKYFPIIVSSLRKSSFNPSCFNFFASSKDNFEPDFCLTVLFFESTKSKVILLPLKKVSSKEVVQPFSVTESSMLE